MKQKLKTGDEWDVVTGWRKVLCWTQRAGACSRVKRRMRRRLRREGKMQCVEEERLIQQAIFDELSTKLWDVASGAQFCKEDGLLIDKFNKELYAALCEEWVDGFNRGVLIGGERC